MKKIYLLSIMLPKLFLSQNTQTRNDAGASGSGISSGFYETMAPVNFPAGASSWWHLLDVRHSWTGNNYAMQFAGSFYDQNLWFRKTNNSASQSWSRVLLENNAGEVRIGKNDSSTSTANLRVFDNGDTVAEVANRFGALQIARASCDGCFGGNAGDTVFRNNGSSHSIVFHLNNDDHDGKSYIGIRDNLKFFVKFFNNYNTVFEGKVTAKEVEVKTGVWADYVFKDDYRLLPLEEVEKHIHEKGHLPNVPSAQEVTASGINLGDMNVKLLEKIEELTLYIIQQDKAIKQLQEDSREFKGKQ